MTSMPNLSVEEDAMPCIATNDEFGFENIPVYHLSSQEGIIDEYNMDDYLKMGDIPEPPESVDLTLSQLLLPKCPSLLSLSVDTKAKPSKRKSASTASKPKKTTKGVRKPRKKKVDGSFKNVIGDLEDVSLHSFGPLQRCGDMLKKAKCRIVKAKATIVKCDDDVRRGSMDDEVALQELDAKIVSSKAELIKMCEDADKLRFKITQKNQSAHCLKMQAEMELQESTKLFDMAASVRDKWIKEFDHAFQSDSD